MRINYRKCGVAAILLILIGSAVWTAMDWWARRQWYELRDQQWAAILRLGQFPPAGCDRRDWENVLDAPYNVWGNVIYTRESSDISNDEMRLLKSKLDQIVAQTTAENSIDSVDRVFQLLLELGKSTEFISKYRAMFREYREYIPRIQTPAENIQVTPIPKRGFELPF